MSNSGFGRREWRCRWARGVDDDEGGILRVRVREDDPRLLESRLGWRRQDLALLLDATHGGEGQGGEGLLEAGGRRRERGSDLRRRRALVFGRPPLLSLALDRALAACLLGTERLAVLLADHHRHGLVFVRVVFGEPARVAKCMSRCGRRRLGRHRSSVIVVRVRVGKAIPSASSGRRRGRHGHRRIAIVVRFGESIVAAPGYRKAMRWPCNVDHLVVRFGKAVVVPSSSWRRRDWLHQHLLRGGRGNRIV